MQPQSGYFVQNDGHRLCNISSIERYEKTVKVLGIIFLDVDSLIDSNFVFIKTGKTKSDNEIFIQSVLCCDTQCLK